MSNRIRELRQDKKMTLKELGEALDLAPNTISQYETGKREPKLERWQEIADYFDVSVGYLQGIIDNDSRKMIVNSYQKELLCDIDLLIESLNETITRSEKFTDRDVALLLSGLKLSKKITILAKNKLLLPPKMRSKKELEEYFTSQVQSILKDFVVDIPETSSNQSTEKSADN